MSSRIKIAIAGGGTGGHVQPALATLQVLREIANVQPLWIGSRDGVERGTAQQNGIPFRSIQTGKLRRYFSLQTPIDAARIPLGALQSILILRRFKPDVVFSTGGFVSVPTVVAAKLLGIPSITHEQTATVGLATRINARFATVIALSFERSRTTFEGWHRRLVVTGNPVRPILFDGSADRCREAFNLGGDRPLIYVTGGALGAHAINEAVMNALPRLLDLVEIIHQCGLAGRNGDLPRLEAARSALDPELQSSYVIRERIGSELPDVFAAASLVVGRAGAGTVAELAALGKPSILIPLPGAGGDEQTLNARVLADAGGAILLPQEQLTPDRLISEVASVLRPDHLERMATAAKTCGRTDSAALLADELLRLARSGE